MTKKLAVFMLAAVLSLWLCGACMAAGEDITAWMTEYLQKDVASISLYEPDEDASSAGELLYNDQYGELQYVLSPEESAAVKSVYLGSPDELDEILAMGNQAERKSDSDGEEESENEISVQEGYRLVVLKLDGMADVTACMDEQFAQSPAQWEAMKAAEKAAEESTEESSGEDCTESAESTENSESLESAESESLTAETPALTAEALPENSADMAGSSLGAEKTTERGGRKALVIALLFFMAAASGEFAGLLKLHKRSENLAKNYIRIKAARDKSKKEKAQAESRSIELERKLQQLQEYANSLQDQLDELNGIKQVSLEKKSPKTKNPNFNIEYFNWM